MQPVMGRGLALPELAVERDHQQAIGGASAEDGDLAEAVGEALVHGGAVGAIEA